MYVHFLSTFSSFINIQFPLCLHVSEASDTADRVDVDQHVSCCLQIWWDQNLSFWCESDICVCGNVCDESKVQYFGVVCCMNLCVCVHALCVCVCVCVCVLWESTCWSVSIRVCVCASVSVC